jgi:hypothetical protein
MAKDNNLTDFLTDVADAIREKKGTTDKINPQDFSDEIKSIKTSTSSSMWTGHVDVEGLKAIGWDDEDIAYFQEHGVNWMEEYDEYYKVSEDNKALYGVLNWANLSEYKDRIVYLPKIDAGGATNWESKFKGYEKMKAMPLLLNSDNIKRGNVAFVDCVSLLYLPPLDWSKSSGISGLAQSCGLIRHIPPLNIVSSNTLGYTFSSCRNLQHIDITTSSLLTNASYLFYVCTSLELVTGDLDVSNVSDFRYFMYGCNCLLSVIPVLDLGRATNVSGFAANCNSLRDIKIKNLPISIAFSQSLYLSKESVLFMINNEAATSPITITLHADAYARLANDPDIVAALSNHPNVSLASA